MTDRDEHLEVLRAIWGEMKTLNSRINGVRDDLGGRIDGLRDFMGARIDALNARVDGTNERLDSQRGDLKEAISSSRFERGRLETLERRVDALEQRTAKPARRPRR